MFKPVKMQKLRIMGLKDECPSLISLLHEAGVLHIKHVSSEELQKGSPLPNYDEVSTQLVRMRSIKNSLPAQDDSQIPPYEINNPLKLASEISIDAELLEISSKKEQLRKKISSLESDLLSLSKITSVPIDVSRLSDPNLHFFFFEVEEKESAHFYRSLHSHAQKYSYTIAQQKEGKKQAPSLVLVATTNESLPSHVSFARILNIPKFEGTPLQAYHRLSFELSTLKGELASLDGRLFELSSKYYPICTILEEALSIEAERCKVAMDFANTNELFFLEGWCPAQKFIALKEEISHKFSKKVFVQPLHDHEMPPTLLSNPKIAAPFQFLTEFLSTPNAHEFDPTLITFFTIPILYGLIVADAGYALISIIFSLLLMRMSSKGNLLYEVSRIWLFSSFFALIFGIAFDEYMGFTHKHLLELLTGTAQGPLYTPILSRIHDIQLLLLITIIIGAIHIGLGFFLGFLTELGHNKKHAYAKLCWLGAEIGGIFAVAGFMFGAFGALAGPAGAALLLLCMLGIAVFEGPILLFEVPSIASNIMSYLRIAAVGVGGLILAEVINELALPHADFSNVGGILIFAFSLGFFMLLHFAMCALSMFEALIHGARLNVVEFFGKFYKGDGFRFAPFSVKRTFTYPTQGENPKEKEKEI
ncbi:V-type ATPase 116kDa subunit family protein [Candidatus Anstonella stagnisolia]|nr:V-type ATPase 116kDa subunit family protein [Candidatus Anstonella stagnisolia]